MTSKNKFLTPNQITFMIFGLFMGPEFFSLPNLAAAARQDAWISVLIGMLYPAYVIIISNIIINKFPDSGILDINKNFFGKFIGTVLNIIFMSQFFLYISTVSSGFSKILQVNLVGFLTYNKILLFCLIISTYAASRGLKTLAKANEFFSYFLLIIVVFSFSALKYASPINLLPVLDSSITNILKGAFDSAYVFTGFEIILLIHPYAKDISKVKYSSYKTLGLCSFIWLWTVLITIMFLGPDIVPKTHSAFLFVLGSINVAAIYNFRYIFLIIWTIIGVKMIGNYIFLSSSILSSITSLKFKNLCFFIAFLSFFISSIMQNESIRDTVASNAARIYSSYNLILFTTLAILASKKKKNLSNESNIKNAN